MSESRNETLTAIPGLRVGHASDAVGGTGLTAILFDRPATAAIHLSGLATSTRQCDGLLPGHSGGTIHAVCLTGGSAFGLDAAAGVVRYLEEQGVGLDLGLARVPIVPTAVIYDLSFKDAQARPTPEMAYAACLNATAEPVATGSIGAGTGATCGKLRSVAHASKAGLGSSLIAGPAGLMVGAIVVANPFGDIINEQGRIIAGAHSDDGNFLNSLNALAGGEVRNPLKTVPANTTLAVVVTNARLDKAACQQVARMATCGLARHIAPFNTLLDGDLVICVSMGELSSHALTIGAMADLACARALLGAGDFRPVAELAS